MKLSPARSLRATIATIATCSLVAQPLVAIADSNDGAISETTTLAVDHDSTIRNPGMGWLMYVEEIGEQFPNPSEYWSTVGPYADEASGLYLRLPWSRMEPQEGHYAWFEDDAYKQLIAGALERGLKLNFRIIVDSSGAHQQATPQWVFDAGAGSYEKQNKLNPDVQDPIFREKFEQFLAAFAEQYDNPADVDFIDMNTIGAWGEMHSIDSLTDEDWAETIGWLDSAYSSAFDRVLLALNYPTPYYGIEGYEKAFNNHNYAMRRDAVGSVKWFKDENKANIKAKFPKSIFIAENCYQAYTIRETSCDDGFKPLDKMMARVVDEALDLHANYLDLRKDVDVVTWNTKQPELVKKFAVNGGYRIAPTTVTYVKDKDSQSTTAAEVTWENFGVGRVPNNVYSWGDRYGIRYLFYKDDGTLAATKESQIDLATLLKGEPQMEKVEVPSSLGAGTYTMKTGIYDRKGSDDAPGIRLALKGTDFAAAPQWSTLGTVMKAADSSRPAPDGSAGGSSSESGTGMGLFGAITDFFQRLGAFLMNIFKIA